MAKIIGIDPGTSNSPAAAMMSERPSIIPSAEGTSVGGKLFSSYEAFLKEGSFLFGEPARRQAVSNSVGTIMAISRSMGIERKVKVYEKEFAPQQVSSFVLQKVKADAEGFLGEQVTGSLNTIHAFFVSQRRAANDAGAIADADRQKKEEADIPNQADSILCTEEKTKSDLRDKIPQDLLTRLNNSTGEMKDDFGKDIETMKDRTETLTDVLKEIQSLAYQQESASQASSSGQSDRTDSTSQKVVDRAYAVDHRRNQ